MRHRRILYQNDRFCEQNEQISEKGFKTFCATSAYALSDKQSLFLEASYTFLCVLHLSELPRLCIEGVSVSYILVTSWCASQII